MPEWRIYAVKSPVGQFIGVARSREEAIEHWGTRAEIQELQMHVDVVRHLLNLRAEGKPERVFIAV